MNTNRSSIGSRGVIVCLAASLFFAFASNEARAQETKLEKCYGVVAKGQDDGLASGPNADIPGSSTVDYDGNAYKWVQQGTCKTISTPHGAGSLTPIPDRPPKS